MASEKNPDIAGGDNAHRVAADQLRAFIERIERVQSEIDELAGDRKEIYAECKAMGYDTKAVRTIVKLRKKDQAERQEEAAILALYADALGMVGVFG